MEVTRNKVEHALGSKLDGKRDRSKHSNFKIYCHGRFIGKASISHGWRKLDGNRLAKVASQLYVSAKDLLDMAECTKGQEWFCKTMAVKGKL
jgi:hypothetical protein